MNKLPTVDFKPPKIKLYLLDDLESHKKVLESLNQGLAPGTRPLNLQIVYASASSRLSLCTLFVISSHLFWGEILITYRFPLFSVAGF